MPRIFIYVVDRDFGFAPNPFHGSCTLATCKAQIRNSAVVGDWIIGVGGRRLKAVGKCVFAMNVSKKITYNEYWNSSEFLDKKPIRNGSKIMMLGDNIYHQNEIDKTWFQAHSHHSNSDGSLNQYNLNRDTKSINVLISKEFYYFGLGAPIIPSELLEEIGYRNRIGHHVYDYEVAKKVIEWITSNFSNKRNLVLDDPFDFAKSEAHYSYETNKVSQ